MIIHEPATIIIVNATFTDKAVFPGDIINHNIIIVCFQGVWLARLSPVLDKS